MLTAYSRVTVVTDQRTIDLALPSALPLADVLPQVMRFAGPEAPEGAPVAWTLGRVGGPSLPLSQTLESAGILDGDVLELRAQGEDVRTALVEDVRDAVEDSTDAAGGVWGTRTSASASVLGGSAVLALWALLVVVDVPWIGVGPASDVTLIVAGALAATAMVGVAWWASVFARPVDAQVAAATALAWGAVLGLAIGNAIDLPGAIVQLIAVAVMALVAGASRLTTSWTTGHVAFAAVLLAASVVLAVVGVLDVPTMQAVRAIPVAALLAIGVLPRVSLSVGGLASADYRVRHVGQLDLEALRFRYRMSNAILVGSLAGLALVVSVAGAALDLSDEPWDRALALSIAAAAALRSRLFSRTPHMVALRVAALVIAVSAAVRLVGERDELLVWLVPATVLVVLALVGLVSIPMSEITRARVKRTLNLVEFLVVVVVLVVAAGALGVFSMIGGIL